MIINWSWHPVGPVDVDPRQLVGGLVNIQVCLHLWHMIIWSISSTLMNGDGGDDFTILNHQGDMEQSPWWRCCPLSQVLGNIKYDALLIKILLEWPNLPICAKWWKSMMKGWGGLMEKLPFTTIFSSKQFHSSSSQVWRGGYFCVFDTSQLRTSMHSNVSESWVKVCSSCQCLMSQCWHNEKSRLTVL